MINLEEMEVNLDDISFDPVTHIVCIMRSGNKIEIGTPLNINDFTALWNRRKGKIKIATGKGSYACINKRRVDFFHVFPVNK